MSTGVFHLPQPVNEPVRDFPPGSPERASLKARLDEMAGRQVEIPMVIGGEEVRTGRTVDVVMPHDHQHVLGTYHQGGEQEVARAIAAAAEARREWSALSWEARASVFLRAAELLAGPWRDTMNAATMLGQSKTAFQAEIDAACELTDFWRWNVSYMHRLIERAADLLAGHLEQDRLPRARGLRLRRLAVQLHGDRREPADRAGADGEHRPLQAGVDRRLLGPLPHEDSTRRRGFRRASSTWCSARAARSATP